MYVLLVDNDVDDEDGEVGNGTLLRSYTWIFPSEEADARIVVATGLDVKVDVEVSGVRAIRRVSIAFTLMS